ncbi:Peptidase S8/S53 domain containing protein [Rhypophila decipiens]
MHISITALLTLLPLATWATPSPGTFDQPPAPLIQARSPGTAIPGKYIVKLKDGSTDAAINKAIGGRKAGHIYRGPGFKGFAGALDSASLEAIRRLPEVDFVEEDATFNALAIVNQTGAPWNLARLSSRTRGSTVYRYDSSAGSGTCVYILDTGINTSHPQFGGRAIWGVNYADTVNTDGNGHGTAMAGVIGATVLGVAKLTKLIAVKVLSASGSGSTSGIIQGMNWVKTDSVVPGRCPNGTVANMSLGGGFSTALNSAAAALVSSGVFLAVAAGGDNANVAGYSPASAPSACTVGASTISDSVASSSNYGPLLDIYAPGQNILTTWPGGGTNTLSGSSLASAHIAGLGAYLLRVNSSLTEQGLCDYMKVISTKNALTGVPTGTNNFLAYNGWDL